MKILVAYAGGLDTSVLLLWLKQKYNAEIIAYCADVGQGDELDGLDEEALLDGPQPSAHLLRGRCHGGSVV